MGANVTPPPSAYDTIRSQKTLLGHPAGLFVLFFTEMWERFSYYGMRALLVLYMVDYLIKNVRAGTVHVLGYMPLQRGIEAVFGPQNIQPMASQIYGIYTALVYLTPLFGGMIADRLLGQRKTVVIGAVLMAIGQFFLAAESMFLVGLFFLIVGNGCFKPNLATQVGGLYPPGDPRMDRAYSIYYMGVNLGAFLAPLVCGTLGQRFGWGYGFAAAGVGMVCGLIFYLWGQKFLAEDSLTRGKKTHVEKVPLDLARMESDLRPDGAGDHQRLVLGGLRAAGQYAADFRGPQCGLACVRLRNALHLVSVGEPDVYFRAYAAADSVLGLAIAARQGARQHQLKWRWGAPCWACPSCL